MKRNLLMVAGPTEIDEDVLARGSGPMVYNRTPDFSKFVLGIEDNLKRIFRTKNDVFIMASSGTGAMEAAVVNLLSEGDEALVVNGGTFGYRWFEIASCYKINCVMIDLPQGETVTLEHIKEKISSKTKAVFTTANETSTGALTDLETVGGFVRETGAILVVDAVSSLCADKLETDKWFCDVVITSSQKALALPPGLSFISLSEKAWRCAETSRIPKYYFDLRQYKSNMTRGQTPFTPPISLLYQLDARLKKILDVGLDETLRQQREKASYLIKGLKTLDLQIVPKTPSNGVVGILFPDNINAYEIVEKLRREHAIEITPSPGEDKQRIARIGLYGTITFEHIDRVLEALKKVLAVCRTAKPRKSVGTAV